MARAAMRQLNETLEAKRGTSRLILENTVVEALARARPTTTAALEALHISKFSANTRASYGGHILATLQQVLCGLLRVLAQIVSMPSVWRRGRCSRRHGMPDWGACMHAASSRGAVHCQVSVWCWQQTVNCRQLCSLHEARLGVALRQQAWL